MKELPQPDFEDAAVTVSTASNTIHDFGGFPRELYQEQYPAPGDPDLAMRVQRLLASVIVRREDGWGLDHGTWSVLLHIFPHTDIPVVQLSIDETQPPLFHYEGVPLLYIAGTRNSSEPISFPVDGSVSMLAVKVG